MGNKNNVIMSTVKKENLINTKSVTKKIKTSNNINFFYDTITFKLIQTLEIKNLKIHQKIHNNKSYYDDEQERTYSFYASKEESYASIILLTINFNDYTIDTKEIIKKHVPK